MDLTKLTRAELLALAKALSVAKKALPETPDAMFVEDGEGDEKEVTLSIKNGRKGRNPAITRRAAQVLVREYDALVYFAETGRASMLTAEVREMEAEESETVEA